MKELERLKKENAQLKRSVLIKDKWCTLINDIGYDYDGYNKAEDLKDLIDELIFYANRSIEADDKYVVYEGKRGDKTIKNNILMEEIK